MDIIRCSTCDALLEGDGQCPDHPESGRVVMKVFDASVGLESSLTLKARHGQPGEVKPFLVKTVKRELWRDADKVEEVERTFDHDARTYAADYRDPVTRAVRFHKGGDLDDQAVHGPRGKKPPTPNADA